MTTTKANDKESLSSSLTEPLLLVEASVANEVEKEESSATPTTSTNIVRAKILASLFGCFMALVSHSILSVFLWKDSILQGAVIDIVVFSVQWSFWTCTILFAAMIMMGRIGNSKCCNSNSNKQQQEDYSFQLEAQYVVAALLTISAIWIMDNIFLALFAVILVLVLLVVIMDQGIMASYSLVAGTLGLIFGACSQFILSLGMWKDVGMTQPVISHLILFSLVWSVLTVIMTFGGCLSLRWIIVADDDTDDTETDTTTTTVASGSNNNNKGSSKNHGRRRAILRMEAVYVANTLVGICAAWIFLDVTAGLPEQILPSIGMLCVSLLAFVVILQCFPEDACCGDEEQQQHDDDKHNVDNNNKDELLLSLIAQKLQDMEKADIEKEEEKFLIAGRLFCIV